MISLQFIDTEVLSEEMSGVKEWIRDFVRSYGKEVGELLLAQPSVRQDGLTDERDGGIATAEGEEADL